MVLLWTAGRLLGLTHLPGAFFYSISYIKV
jgi:hypothetical protein